MSNLVSTAMDRERGRGEEMQMPALSAAAVVAVILAAAPGCRCAGGAPAEVGPDAAAPSEHPASASAGPSALPDEAPPEQDEDASDSSGDASTRFREAGPKVDRDLEGPADPACTGSEITFATAVVDARCAITSTRARKLRARLERDGGLGLRQDAKVGADGRVALRLVNKSGSPLALPLSFHGKLPAFSVLAEDERHTLYELESPELDLRDRGEGSRSRFARIVLPPEGVAVATFRVSPTIVRVLGRGATDPCRTGDAGACRATKLGKGHYVLHLGELLTDVEAGAPARIEVDLP